MKNFNLKTKPSSLFVKGISALSLSLLLQAENCSPPGATGHLVFKVPVEEFFQKLEDLGPAVFTFNDEKNRKILFALVKRRLDKKLEIFFDFCAKKGVSDPQFNDLLIKEINETDPKSQNTPLMESIEQDCLKIFQLLVAQEGIDINQPSNGISPLFAALKYQRYKMADELLSQPNIDIEAKDIKSGNRAIHFAIGNQWEVIAKKLIHLHDRGLLYAQNKHGNTPLHLAMQYRLPNVQSELIKLISEDKEELSIKNKQDQTVIDVAIKYKQEKGIRLINELPIKVLCAKNQNGSTLLHTAAYRDDLNVFKLVLNRIIQLAEKEVVKKLFEKDKDGKTVWPFIYLSQMDAQPFCPETNIEMFKYTIEAVQHYLQPADTDAILEEINQLERTNNLQGGITKGYANKLRKIVSALAPTA